MLLEKFLGYESVLRSKLCQLTSKNVLQPENLNQTVLQHLEQDGIMRQNRVPTKSFPVFNNSLDKFKLIHDLSQHIVHLAFFE